MKKTYKERQEVELGERQSRRTGKIRKKRRRGDISISFKGTEDEGAGSGGAGAPACVRLPLLRRSLHGGASDHRRDDGGALPRPRPVLPRHLPHRPPASRTYYSPMQISGYPSIHFLVHLYARKRIVSWASFEFRWWSSLIFNFCMHAKLHACD